MSPEHVAIWFGILVLIVVEVGLITPPVGMNLFIINCDGPQHADDDTYKAVLFFRRLRHRAGASFWCCSRPSRCS